MNRVAASKAFNLQDELWPHVQCPVCGDYYTHVHQVYALESVGEYADPGYQGAELYGIPVGGIAEGWRRGAVVIELDCESGHAFSIQLQQHKGNTAVIVNDKGASAERA